MARDWWMALTSWRPPGAKFDLRVRLLLRPRAGGRSPPFEGSLSNWAWIDGWTRMLAIRAPAAVPRCHAPSPQCPPVHAAYAYPPPERLFRTMNPSVHPCSPDPSTLTIFTPPRLGGPYVSREPAHASSCVSPPSNTRMPSPYLSSTAASIAGVTFDRYTSSRFSGMFVSTTLRYVPRVGKNRSSSARNGACAAARAASLRVTAW